MTSDRRPPSALYSTVQVAGGAEPDPARTDAIAMGWMHGFPPPEDRIVRAPQSGQFPQLRWAFSHRREIGPSVNIWRGKAQASALAPHAVDLTTLSFIDDEGSSVSFEDMLVRSFTDSIVVLHRGQIVYERYFGAAQPELPHRAFSVTKSFVGVLAGILSAERALDVDSPVVHYVPELAHSAFGDATVRHLLDMTTAVQFSEVYTDPKAEIWNYARSGGFLPVEPGYVGPRSFYEFLPTLRKSGTHGVRFDYKTINTEVLGWILRRVSGQSLARLLSERLWQPLGMEEDGYFEVDSIGTEGAGAGLNLTVRDAARFGEMIRLEGSFNGGQIVPPAVIHDLRSAGDPAQFARAEYFDMPGFRKGAAYRNQWWVSNDAHGVFDARGIYGQRIYIDPAAEMVLARFGSHHIASNMGIAPFTDLGYEALANHLMHHR